MKNAWQQHITGIAHTALTGSTGYSGNISDLDNSERNDARGITGILPPWDNKGRASVPAQTPFRTGVDQRADGAPDLSENSHPLCAHSHVSTFCNRFTSAR